MDSDSTPSLRRRSLLRAAAWPAGAGVLAGGVGFVVGASQEGHPVALPEESGRPQRSFIGGPGDQTSRFQEFLESLMDGESVLVEGDFETRTVTTRANGIWIRLSPGTKVRFRDPFEDGLRIEGDDVRLEGGVWEGSPSWNGVNTHWEYALIHAIGRRFTAMNVTLINVPKVGFGLRSDGGRILSCRIVGGYPSDSWTGSETGHFGIAFDPSLDSERADAGTVLGTTITSCVQGISIANMGSGADGSYQVSQNSFNDCHNHGIYAQSGTGSVINGNAFVGCQVPIVVSGSDHVVTGNTLRAKGDGTSRDYTGINLRDGIDCVIADNVIKGKLSSTNVAISLDAVLGSRVTGNVVRGNVISVEGEGQPSIRVGQGSSFCEFNRVEGNLLNGGGRVGGGVIMVTAHPQSPGGKFNEVSSNTVRVRGRSAGILMERQLGGTVADNIVIAEVEEHDLPVVQAVVLRNAARTLVRGNISRTMGGAAIKDPLLDFSGTGNFFIGNINESAQGLKEVSVSRQG